ncbi:MAG: aminomethyl-transferring glycine dehydrogenase subunit GcvPA [Pseudomonadota bacterium]
MRYLPHTPEEIGAMLEAIGVPSLDDLFGAIPLECRRTRELDLPGPLTEWELADEIGNAAGRMAVPPEYVSFVGAGRYEHFIPQSIAYLLGRSEFTTAYTPYQPEMSQGTLQAIFEYQTLICRLFGMEAANASLYDGGSALAEAMLMAIRVTRRERVAVSRAVHPLYRRVAATYLQAAGYEIIELPYDRHGGTDMSSVADMEGLAAVAIQSPNFFGCIEDLGTGAALAHEKGALFVTAFSEPLAYGLLKNPGSQGADIVCGEGGSFGIPKSFGGPGLGIFSTLMKYVRSMPGRLVGRTTDLDGRPGFVLTLATREQHIRREKATSNICTNSSLCALTAAMYLASVGGTGLRELARLNRDKAEYLKRRLAGAGFKIPFGRATFNEFIVDFGPDFESKHKELMDKKMVAGLHLETYYPELAGHYLLCVTETRTRARMDALLTEIVK